MRINHHQLAPLVAVQLIAMTLVVSARAAQNSTLLKTQEPKSLNSTATISGNQIPSGNVTKLAASSATVQPRRSVKQMEAGLFARFIDPLLPANAKAIKVESKSGRALARMQGKRQADPNGFSRRNEDPWFLDSPPYPLQPYRFVYNVKGKNGQTEQYRQEVGDGKFLTGTYGYVLPDGIYRHVDYVADDRGFRAFIRTSEPGTANQNPADVVINSNPVPVIPGVTYATLPVSISPPRDTALPFVNSYANFSTPKSTFGNDNGLSRIRRPPGSIVGTPARNFTSYTFTTTPAPFLDSYGGSRVGSGSFGPLFRESNLGVKSTPTSNNQQLTNWNDNLPSSGPKQSDGEAGAGKSYRRPELPLQQQSPNRVTSYQPPEPSISSHFSVPIRHNEYFYRTGPNVINYDVPLTIQGGNLEANKLAYDVNLIHHTNFYPLSSYEKSSFGTNLGPAGSPFIRPTNSFDSLGHLTPPQSPELGSIGNLGLLQNDHVLSVGRTSSESSHETHHKSQRENEGPDNTRVTVTKEHHSGSKTSSGREFEFRKPAIRLADGDEQLPLLPPPAPKFPATKSSSSQLELPVPQQEPESVEFRRELNFTIENGEPVSQFLTTSRDSGAVKGTTAQRNWDPSDSQSESPPPPSSARIERAPGEYRSSLMMNDLRSMQNVIGLPQPPRLHSPTFASNQRHLHEERIDSKLKLADQVIDAKLKHVDALLRSQAAGEAERRPILSLPSSSDNVNSGRAASSIRPSVTLSNVKPPEPEVERPKNLPTISTRRSGDTEPMIRPTSLNKLVNFSHPKSKEPLPSSNQVVAANETEFEAQRLVKAARLQAEKVSELEKFQQRLKTQQSLLAQSKKQSIDKPANKTVAISSKPQPKSTESNSHVKFDEDNENTISTENSARPREENQRSRRQEEQTPSTLRRPQLSPVTSTTTTTTTPRPSTRVAQTNQSRQQLSDLAQLIKAWPSLASNASKVAEPSAESNLSAGQGPTKRANLAENQPNSSSRASHSVARITTDQEFDRSSPSNSPGNTINLDFINSVTALSMDQLNPFAVASVNPSIKRNSEPRLSPHKLERPSIGVATTNARYFNPPELLAAAGLQESTNKPPERTSSSTSSQQVSDWPSNHRFEAPSSPYMLTGAHTANTLVQLMPSSTGRVPPTPIGTLSLHPNHKSASSSVSLAADSRSVRDGFEVRDSSVEVGNQNFFEVVSNARQPAESSEFQAFRDPQLSVLANARRRRRHAATAI